MTNVEITQVDLDLIEYYASMHPSDPRLNVTLASRDGQRILEIAKRLLEEDDD